MLFKLNSQPFPVQFWIANPPASPRFSPFGQTREEERYRETCILYKHRQGKQQTDLTNRKKRKDRWTRCDGNTANREHTTAHPQGSNRNWRCRKIRDRDAIQSMKTHHIPKTPSKSLPAQRETDRQHGHRWKPWMGLGECVGAAEAKEAQGEEVRGTKECEWECASEWVKYEYGQWAKLRCNGQHIASIELKRNKWSKDISTKDRTKE